MGSLKISNTVLPCCDYYGTAAVDFQDYDELGRQDGNKANQSSTEFAQCTNI